MWKEANNIYLMIFVFCLVAHPIFHELLHDELTLDDLLSLSFTLHEALDGAKMWGWTTAYTLMALVSSMMAMKMHENPETVARPLRWLANGFNALSAGYDERELDRTALAWRLINPLAP